jgi:acyl carrier protein
MTKNEFLGELAEIMQLDTLPNGSENLEDFSEWDSMSSLAVISMFDMEFGVTLSSDNLRNVKSIPELIAMAGDQIHG